MPDNSIPGCSRFPGEAALSVSLLSRGMPLGVGSSHEDVLDPDSSSSVTVGFLSSPKWFYKKYTEVLHYKFSTTMTHHTKVLSKEQFLVKPKETSPMTGNTIFNRILT